MRSLFITALCTVALILGGAIYFAIEPGVRETAPRVVLKIAPPPGPADGEHLADASSSAAEPAAGGTLSESVAPPAGTAPEAPARVVEAQPGVLRGALDAPAAGPPLRSSLEDQPVVARSVATPGGEAPMEHVAELAPEEALQPPAAGPSSPSPAAPAFPAVGLEAPAAAGVQPSETPALTLPDSHQSPPADLRQASIEPEPAASPEGAAAESGPAALPPAEAGGATVGAGVPVGEQSASLADPAAGLPFRSAADQETEETGGGVSLEGLETVEASPDVLELARIERAESVSEPLIANAAGLGIDMARAAAARRRQAPAPKGPPRMLSFSAATIAAAAKHAPSVEDAPVSGSDPEPEQAPDAQ